MIKKDKYKNLIKTADLVLETEPKLSFNARMSVLSSILHSYFPHWLFCGFYTVINNNILEIGPYQGHILPCTHIKFGQGVCGEVALKGDPIIVKDVSKYNNYISCDPDTKSEIVIPIFKNNKIISVLDIDSKVESDFDELDLKYLTRASTII
ncbi:MAG: GAF domain-containing protein [Fidelibacterota bacterium]|jgi:L-methionine (R)-S-oxide reductase|tara:strand:- start:5024 stop:5479 length:456 start_codon:yes stop_codon:yes gene_type:complete